MRRLLAKLSNLFHRRRAENEMTREIASHLALLEDEFLGRGMDLPEARLAARRAYGGVEQAKELHREARSLVRLEQMLQDVRHACRSLRKIPASSRLPCSRSPSGHRSKHGHLHAGQRNPAEGPAGP